jgi:hypothetical protein
MQPRLFFDRKRIAGSTLRDPGNRAEKGLWASKSCFPLNERPEEDREDPEQA